MAIKVLVAVDGSRHSDRAVEQVVKLAKSGAALDVTVINVQHYMSIEAQELHLQEYGTEAMQSARRILDAAGVTYGTHIAMGHAAEKMIEYANAHGTELLVIGTHGLGFANTVLVGSVAKKCVDHSTIPVLLVR